MFKKLLTKAGRFFAAVLAGVKGVAEYDAAPDNRRDDVLIDQAENLAQRELDKLKPEAKKAIEIWAVNTANGLTQLKGYTTDQALVTISRLILANDRIPQNYRYPLLAVITITLQQINLEEYYQRPAEKAINEIAAKLKNAIDGARL